LLDGVLKGSSFQIPSISRTQVYVRNKIKHRIRKKYKSEWKGTENSVLAFLKSSNREGPVQLRLPSVQRCTLAAALHSSTDRDFVTAYFQFFLIQM